MLHPTMLGDVGPTCWLRLNRPLTFDFFLSGDETDARETPSNMSFMEKVITFNVIDVLYSKYTSQRN